MAEAKKIAKSKNFIQLSGTLLETNLVVTKEVKCQAWSNKDGKMKDIVCDVVKKKDFKNPAILIECSPKDDDGNIIGTYQIGVDFSGIGFGITSHQFDRDTDKKIENSNFKGIVTCMNDYVTRKDAKEGEEATKVFIKSGGLTPNEYADKEGTWKSYTPTITTYNITSSGLPDNDICEGNATGIIRSIIDEVVNEEETGRLKVELFMFDAKGETFPVTFTVEKDLADDFKDFYDGGVSCKVYFDVLTKQVGTKKVASSGGFGRRETKTTSGFSVVEYSIFKGEEPFEEEHENFVGKAEMKKAMESRTITIEQKCKDAKDKAKNGGASKPKGGLGSKASKLSEVVEDNSDDSLPF